MKSFIVFCFIAAALAFDDEVIVTKEFTEKVKSMVSWEVEEYEDNIFKDWTVGDAKSFLLPSLDKKPSKPSTFKADAPEEYNFNTAYPSCVIPIKNQGRCGSCWSFGSTGAASDRFCKKISSIVDLSPQWLVSCDKYDHACNGGGIDTPFRWMKDHGVVLEKCMPYVSGSGSVPPCPGSKCSSSEAFKLYYCGSLEESESVEGEKKLILDNGPVDTGFAVYEDFKLYKSGVYYHKTGRLLGYHAVEVIGWGKESGLNYWLCRNSWGATWGMSGYFKIKMGDCEIDGGAACIVKA